MSPWHLLCDPPDPWSFGLFLLSVTSLYSLMMTYRKIPWVIILCTLGIVLGYMCSHDVQLHLFTFTSFFYFPSFFLILSHALVG
jgi:uncharacterized membrane protein